MSETFGNMAQFVIKTWKVWSKQTVCFTHFLMNKTLLRSNLENCVQSWNAVSYGVFAKLEIWFPEKKKLVEELGPASQK